MFWRKDKKRRLDEFEKNLISHVEEHGFSANYVFDPDGKEPDFTYSIGFRKTLNCSDFIVFGLPKELMHNMLWEVFRQVKAGKVPDDGIEWDDLLLGQKCVSKRLHPSNHTSEFLSSSLWYNRYLGHEAKDFEAFQLVWPGSNDRKFPWEEGAHISVIEAQPPLWLEAEKTVRESSD
ncbi:MAG: DUF4262 domain-containing protein [Hellea sp.]